MRNSKVIQLGAVLFSLLATTACKSSDSNGGGSAIEQSAEAGKPPRAATTASLTDTSATDTSPAVWKARFETTKGKFTVEIHRDWAPLGADRFYHLVKIGYFTDIAFFRCIKGFMVQFGIHGDPTVSAAWKSAHINDDPTGKQSNTRGMLTFATAGPNTRTNQFFINYGNNTQLDHMGFAPIGKVLDGMDVVDSLEGKYGEGAPGGAGPAQGRVQAEGNAYLKSDFPGLDYIKKAVVL